MKKQRRRRKSRLKDLSSIKILTNCQQCHDDVESIVHYHNEYWCLSCFDKVVSNDSVKEVQEQTESATCSEQPVQGTELMTNDNTQEQTKPLKARRKIDLVEVGKMIEDGKKPREVAEVFGFSVANAYRLIRKVKSLSG
jgi:hypothetical protein